MNQTDTPRTDSCSSTPDRGGIRSRTWKVNRLVAVSRDLEHELAVMRAALESIAEYTNLEAGRIARAALGKEAA